MENIARIKELDLQLANLQRIIKDGSFMGAGIEIRLSVGVPEDGAIPDVKINLCTNLQEILEGVRYGIVEARAERIRFVQNDLKELTEFMANEGAK